MMRFRDVLVTLFLSGLNLWKALLSLLNFVLKKRISRSLIITNWGSGNNFIGIRLLRYEINNYIESQIVPACGVEKEFSRTNCVI